MYTCPACNTPVAARARWLHSASFVCSNCGATLCMSPTQPTLWAFRATVAIGLIGLAYFSRAGQRYLLWATLIALLLALVALQSLGKVTHRDPGTAPPDRLAQAVNGPNALRVRIALLLILVLVILLGVGALEPSAFVEWFIKAKNAA